MKKSRFILLFLLVTAIVFIVPFTAQAKQSGYFIRSNNNKYVEYHLANGSLVKNKTVKSGKNTYLVQNGRVMKINGKDVGTVKTKMKKTVLISKGNTYNGIYGSKVYKNGLVNTKANGFVKINNVKYYCKKGTLFTGIYKSKYYKKGKFQSKYIGFVKYNKKTYLIGKGKLFTGLYYNKYYVKGLVNTKLNGFKTLYGNKYYFIKGVVSDPTVANPLKILLVGNSYTYYQGYAQMLSKMIAKTKKSAIVVRASKGDMSITELMTTNQISYAAFKDGNVIAEGSNTKLENVIKIDFGGLKRAGKWDYIIAQNNASSSNVTSGDVSFYNMIKGNIVNSKRYIIHGMYYAASTSTSRYNEHLKAVQQCNCSIINSNAYYSIYKANFKRSWVEDLTIQDSVYHPSGRGGYLLALCIYARIFGTNTFARSETDNAFIPLYNKAGGTTKEFAPNKYNKKSSATAFSMSVELAEAKKLQAFVRNYSDVYIGVPLYIQDYVL